MHYVWLCSVECVWFFFIRVIHSPPWLPCQESSKSFAVSQVINMKCISQIQRQSSSISVLVAEQKKKKQKCVTKHVHKIFPCAVAFWIIPHAHTFPSTRIFSYTCPVCFYYYYTVCHRHRQTAISTIFRHFDFTDVWRYTHAQVSYEAHTNQSSRTHFDSIYCLLSTNLAPPPFSVYHTP